MAARITSDESMEQVQALLDAVAAASKARDDEVELEACWAALEHPCAHHLVDEREILDEIHQVLRRLGRFDEAIQAKREAIAAGSRSFPDPEADIAECLVLAGRRAEADALYAELRRRDPDDVWLYNSAGWAFADIDDDEALRWLLDGIDTAITTGDPDQVIGQLLDMTRGCWDRMGRTPDVDLVARVEAFERTWVRPRQGRQYAPSAHPQPLPRRCGHCDYDPDPPLLRAAERSRPGAESSSVAVSLAWFPADEWALAVERWPDLVDDDVTTHDAYTRRIEARLKWLARERAARVLSVSPLRVEELVATEGDDAGTGTGRSHLAAEMARTGRAIAWPPARNERCWCGSGRKYKACCGPVPAATDGES